VKLVLATEVSIHYTVTNEKKINAECNINKSTLFFKRQVKHKISLIRMKWLQEAK